MDISKKNSLPTVYYIEGIVKFDSSTGILHSINEDFTFSLLAASSECFISLLENHGSLVSKKDLIMQGWGKYGLHVSDNTFYQNILVLRKGLKACGIEKEIIKTIPRKGLMVPQDVIINHVNPDLPKSAPSIKEAGISSSLPSSLNSSSSEEWENSHSRNMVYKKESFPLSTIHPLIFTPVILFVFITSIFTSVTESSYFSKFKYITRTHECRLYMPDEKNSDMDFQNSTLIKSIFCKENELLYLSVYKYISRVSVIKCTPRKNDLNKVDDCISFYYLEKA